MKRGPPIMAALDRAEPLANPARDEKGDVMRALRLALVGAAILALLGGPATAAVAQDEEGPVGPALVTGRGTCSGMSQQNSAGLDWHRTHASGGTCAFQMDDPRLTGPGMVDFNSVFYLGSRPGSDDDGGFYWGDIEVTGPDGSWVGFLTGVDDITEWEATGMRQQILMVLEGTEAYEGQTFLAHVEGNLSSPTLKVNGLVYEGPPPPWEQATQ